VSKKTLLVDDCMLLVMQVGSDTGKARSMDCKRRQQRKTEDDSSSSLNTHRDTGRPNIAAYRNCSNCDMHLNLQLKFILMNITLGAEHRCFKYLIWHTHTRARAGLTTVLPGEPGLTGFPLDSPFPYILFTPSHYVLYRQDKGRRWRKRSGGKVHSTRGNWCRDFEAWCPLFGLYRKNCIQCI